jgi:hypothetical protein
MLGLANFQNNSPQVESCYVPLRICHQPSKHCTSIPNVLRYFIEITELHISKHYYYLGYRKEEELAGAELCQAQVKLG